MKKYGGTPGKLITGIVIIKTDLSSINWNDTFKRNIDGIIYSIINSILTVYVLSKNDNTILFVPRSNPIIIYLIYI